MPYQPDYDFKIDLPQGEEAERTVAFLLGLKDGELIEVKRDYKVSDTGSVAIEYEFDGRPSGIAKTKAYWWAIFLNGQKYNGEIIVLIRTDRLKGMCRKYLYTDRDRHGGDNNKAKMVLLPVEELLI